MSNNTPVDNKKILRIIATVIGIVFLFCGILVLFASEIGSSVIYICMGLLLLHPIREMIRSRLNIDLTIIKTIVLLAVGLTIQLILSLSSASGKLPKNTSSKQNIITSTVNQDSINKLIDSVENIRVAEQKENNKKLIDELSPFFTFKKDEFSTDGMEFVTPKSAPSYTNVNGVYCYFARNKLLRLSEMRLRIQYTADDWLFIQKVIFSIDGDVREYNTPVFERDNDSRIWEWSDKELTLIGDKYMLKDIANAKVVKMKLVGKQYENVRQLTSSEILNIKRTVDLYNAMGGELTN